MNKIILFFLFVALSFTVEAQQISFCEKVDAKGNAINSSHKFSISKKGSYLYFQVNMPQEINCTNITYDLFWIDAGGKEHFDNTVRQKVDPSWMSFWKQIDFYHPGNYRVYAYDDFDKFLCAGELSVVMK